MLMKKLLLMLILFIGCVSYAQISTTVEFEVNTSKIIKNENFTYFQEILPKLNSSESILIIGAASPEGNIERNIQLANERADVILSNINPKISIVKSTDYSLFLQKTHLDESDYRKLRAVYIEVNAPPKELTKEIITKRDTLYIKDTLYVKDTIYINKEPEPYIKVMSLYTDLVSAFTPIYNIGIELYIKNWSVFAERYTSKWYAGIRYYPSNFFIEGYYSFAKDMFGAGIGTGYTLNLGKFWAIRPIIRVGFTRSTSMIVAGDITFGEYHPGQTKGNNIEEQTTQTIYTKQITDYFGPTFIGLTFQRNFYIRWKR